jgi:ferredoxin, 2Fe-2S
MPAMSTVTLLSPRGKTVASLAVAAGQSVMLAAVQANVGGIEAECGGCLSCATCHVYVREVAGELPAATQEELAMLEFVAAERRRESRLSCQLLGGPALQRLLLELPERQV